MKVPTPPIRKRDFRTAIAAVLGVDGPAWTPRELRHSSVSLLSDSGVPIEEISRLVGHKSTLVTELVYRKQLRPAVQAGAVVMDRLFAGPAEGGSHSVGHSEAVEPGSSGEVPGSDLR